MRRHGPIFRDQRHVETRRVRKRAIISCPPFCTLECGLPRHTLALLSFVPGHALTCCHKGTALFPPRDLVYCEIHPRILVPYGRCGDLHYSKNAFCCLIEDRSFVSYPILVWICVARRGLVQMSGLTQTKQRLRSTWADRHPRRTVGLLPRYQVRS